MSDTEDHDDPNMFKNIMSLAMSHANSAQANRYWSLGEKYTGLNGSFITYLNELVKEVEFQLGQKKENTRAFEIRHRALAYLSLIQRLKLASGEAIRKHDEMIVIRYMIRHHPLPEIQEKKEKYSGIKKSYDWRKRI